MTVGRAKELGASAWELKDWKDKGCLTLEGGTDVKGGNDAATKREIPGTPSNVFDSVLRIPKDAKHKDKLAKVLNFGGIDAGVGVDAAAETSAAVLLEARVSKSSTALCSMLIC